MSPPQPLKEGQELLKAELNMLRGGTKSKSANYESKLQVIDYDDRDRSFILKAAAGHFLRVSDTYAEMFHLTATAGSVLNNSLLFWTSKQS